MMGCSIHVICDMSFVAMGIVMRIGSVHCLLLLIDRADCFLEVMAGFKLTGITWTKAGR
jgi:hypothetical protein